MDSETKKLLQENLELTKENNGILKKIRRGQRWQQISRAVYLLIIIAVTLGAFVYLQPMIEKVQGIFSGKPGDVQSLKLNIPDVNNLQGLYDQLNKPKK